MLLSQERARQVKDRNDGSQLAGYLKVQVTRDYGRSGLLSARCVLFATPQYGGRISDGISLRSEGLNFTDSTQNEMGVEGVMFYGPGST